MREPAELLPSLAVLCAGFVWGAFWLPLRALEAAGFSGAWAAPPPIAVSVLILLPVVLWRWRRLVAAGWGVALLGMASGTGYALYSDALLLTEIVTAILLFYLTPVWSTILARMVLGQPITGLRMGTIALGLAGLWVILGIDGGFPTPRGLGDWLGLVSGMIWAVATVCFRKRSDVDPVQMAFYYLSGTLVMATVIALVFMPPEAGTFGRLAAAALAAWLSLPFISSAVETLEFCMPTGYLFRHAQDHQHAHLRLPRNRPWPRSASHRNPCPATAGSCPETEKAPAIASEGG